MPKRSFATSKYASAIGEGGLGVGEGVGVGVGVAVCACAKEDAIGAAIKVAATDFAKARRDCLLEIFF